MEFHLTNISKIEVFTTIFQNLMVFSDLVNLQFSENGLYIQGMDNSHISVYELQIPGTWFNKYISPNKKIIIGINTVIFSKILSSREKTQEMKIIYDSEKDSDKLCIFMGNFTNKKIINTDTDIEIDTNTIINENENEKTKKKTKKEKEIKTKKEMKIESQIFNNGLSAPFDRNFEMPLVDIETELVGIPEFDYEAEITLCAAKFAAVIQQLKLFNDTMVIFCNEEKILMNSEDNNSAFMTVEIKIDEVTEYSIDEGKEIKLCYGLNYMNNICKFYKISKEVKLCLTSEYPIKMIYDIGEGANMNFYLAPKINDD